MKQTDKSTAVLKGLNTEKQIDRNVNIYCEFEDLVIKNCEINENITELTKSISNLIIKWRY